MRKTILGTVPNLCKAAELQTLLLEGILAELRFLRGMSDGEVEFLKRNSDAALRMDEFQAMRRAVFPAE